MSENEKQSTPNGDENNIENSQALSLQKQKSDIEDRKKVLRVLLAYLGAVAAAAAAIFSNNCNCGKTDKSFVLVSFIIFLFQILITTVTFILNLISVLPSKTSDADETLKLVTDENYRLKMRTYFIGILCIFLMITLVASAFVPFLVSYNS